MVTFLGTTCVQLINSAWFTLDSQFQTFRKSLATFITKAKGYLNHVILTHPLGTVQTCVQLFLSFLHRWFSPSSFHTLWTRLCPSTVCQRSWGRHWRTRRKKNERRASLPSALSRLSHVRGLLHILYVYTLYVCISDIRIARETNVQCMHVIYSMAGVWHTYNPKQRYNSTTSRSDDMHATQ